MASIRRLVREDWELLRAIRLEMLADSPLAYLETLSAARRQTDTQWQERAAMMSSGPNITLLADGGTGDARVRGLMRVALKEYQEPEQPRRAILLSVYVAPAYRGLGLAEELLGEACRVARAELGAAVLELGVHEDNERAKAFYLRHGFGFTGESRPFPQDRSRPKDAARAGDTVKRELTMERGLSVVQARDAAGLPR
ncbi:GNAT family N-acetyltransferase [Arthrobacter celericrescens]|uniref:GNAT family N-acetyltransferase n=1 Tax=Arthrobacter celericrescens TaxID=2320851 RepID=UPI001FDEE2E7|nr:N-acetyltransferase [Arthrobacter celericrescens]